ncbi:MAG: hypothetical protein ACOX0E_06905 [Syntrophomonadaceae bacterium]|jgi:hypothetical protein
MTISKLTSLPLEVYCDQEDKPVKIKLNNYLAKITDVLEYWHDTGCWWEGESEKAFYRIACQDGAIMEIFKELASGSWFIYKIYD